MTAILETHAKRLFKVGDIVDVTPKENHPPHEFRGRVIGYRSPQVVQVKDQDDDVFDVDEDQCQTSEE